MEICKLFRPISVCGTKIFFHVMLEMGLPQRGVEAILKNIYKNIYEYV